MFKFKRIGTKITIAIIGVALVISTLISSIGGNIVFESFTEASIEKSKLVVKKETSDFNKQFQKIENSVEVLNETIKTEFEFEDAINDPTYLSDFNDKWHDNLRGLATAHDYSSIYVFFNSDIFDVAIDTWLVKNDEGTLDRQDMYELSYFDGDLTKDWWYGPINSQKASWTIPYMSRTGDLITSYISPIIVDDKSIGLVGMDFNLSELREYLNSIQLYKTGYLYMMDKNYNFIVHPTLEMGTNLADYPNGSDIVEMMEANESGNIIFEKDKVKKTTAFTRLDNGWIIASSIPLNETREDVITLLKKVLIIIMITFVISIFVALALGRSISKPIKLITKIIGDVKNGDFTAEAFVKSNDEIKLLSDGLNEMIFSTKNLINSTKTVSLNMLDSASALATMAEETSATSEEVSRTVGEIAIGATEQAHDAESGILKADMFDEMVKQLMKDSNEMNNFAENAMGVSREGASSLKQLKEKSLIGEESNKEISKAISRLDQKANSITTIIETITSISEKTNLLALNASIEAARAGDAGRGFAVVADEIRKLAESSSRSAGEIQKLVLDIQIESNQTVIVMNNLQIISGEQKTAVEYVSESIANVFVSIEGIFDQIEKVNKRVNNLDVIKDDITSVIGKISAVSEETAAATEEVTASMDQQNYAIEEVSKKAKQLNELSKELSNEISRFKVS